jgi:hypothetical protein
VRWETFLSYALPVGFLAIIFVPPFFMPHDDGMLMRWAFVGPLVGFYLGFCLPRRNSN